MPATVPSSVPKPIINASAAALSGYHRSGGPRLKLAREFLFPTVAIVRRFPDDARSRFKLMILESCRRTKVLIKHRALQECAHLWSQYFAAAQKGSGIAIPGLGGAMLATALVNGTRRLEIRNYRPEDRERLKARGGFSEVIQYSTLLFVRLDRSNEVVETIVATTRI